MDMNIRGHSSIKILFLVLIALRLFQLVTSEEDYRWCLYQLITYPMPWAAANVACQEKGLTLAVFSEWVTHEYLRSLVATSIQLLDANAPETMWIGLHKDKSGTIRQGNCRTYTAIDYNPTKTINNDCLVFNAADTEFEADECTSAKPFLCEHEIFNLDNCYDYVSLVRPHYRALDVVLGRPSYQACPSICTSDCVGFRYIGGTCSYYTSDVKPLDGRGAWYYTKAVLQKDPHAVVGDVIAATDLCSSLVPAGGNIDGTGVNVPFTSSPDTLQTSYGAVIDVTMAGVDLTTAGVDDTPSLYTGHVTQKTVLRAVVTTPAAQTNQQRAQGTPDHLSQQSVSKGQYVTQKMVTTPIVTTPAAQTHHQTAQGTPDHLSQQSDSQDIQITNSASDSLDLSSTCHCPCDDQSNDNITSEQLKEKVEELKSQLVVKKKGLSSWKRKLVSAPDSRVSAKGIGMFGAGILIAVAALIIILDIPTLVAEIKKLTNTLKLICRCEEEAIVVE